MNIDSCPFCAKPTEEVLFTEDYFAHVICRSCGACGPSVAIFEMSEGESARERAVSLWNKRPLSLPSKDDKTPHSPTVGENSGTPDLKVGDEVKLPDITTGTILSTNIDGTMAVGMLDGTVRYTNTQEVVKL
jgi:hypothetical protein